MLSRFVPALVLNCISARVGLGRNCTPHETAGWTLFLYTGQDVTEHTPAPKSNLDSESEQLCTDSLVCTDSSPDGKICPVQASAGYSLCQWRQVNSFSLGWPHPLVFLKHGTSVCSCPSFRTCVILLVKPQVGRQVEASMGQYTPTTLAN